MGTKNDPGKFDCYAEAFLDEPVFVLMARDPIAPLLVELWAKLKEQLDGYGPEGRGTDKTREARTCATAMAEWARNPNPAIDAKVYELKRRIVTLLFQRH